MHDIADHLAGSLVSEDAELAREFEARLADSSTLAVRVAFAVLRHRQDAEDVAQDAFVRAHRAFRALRDRDKFRSWLVRTTWRLALDARRGGRRRTVREDAVARLSPQSSDGEAEMLATERSRRLWCAIDELPDKLRVVIVLAAIEGHGVSEVGALLEIPAGTVKSRLFEARRQLQERLR